MTIYCSGIGGIGLSAYAALQRAAGHIVRGSDGVESALLEDLRGQGIEVFTDQDGSHVTADIDLFVYSEAIPEDAPERAKATALKIPQQSYFHALGDLSKPYVVIAVCGTHGKSSTTAMLAKVLVEAGKDPTVVVGTKSPDLGGRNWRKGGSDLFLVEACEYRKSFHFLSPDVAVFTNVDGDHFDAFASIEDYQRAFVDFFKLLPPEGKIVLHGDDAACAKTASESGKSIINADAFPLPAVGVPGEHMRQNARLTLAASQELGVPDAQALGSLAAFAGTWRRMDVKGTRSDGVTVIDDYAHHPIEIRVTLQGIRDAYPDRRIVCVFQPHTHDRTLKLYDEFLPVFANADLVIVPNIYAARGEVDTAQANLPAFIADIARESGIEVLDGGGLEQTLTLLGSIVRPGDVVITMGAGDVTSLAPKILRG